MRIGVNTRLLLSGKLEGIGYFAYQVLQRITTRHKDIEFVFFFDRKYDKDFVFSDNVKPVVIPLQARHPYLWKIYFDYLLPLYCKMYKIDLFFSPENYLPKAKSLPMICTIHDLNFIHDNSFIGNGLHQKYFMKYFPVNAKNAVHIATVSSFSKEDIVSSLKINPDKITVVYADGNACDADVSQYDLQTIRDTYAFGKEYFYFVGAISKRKNLVGIFKAFDLFKEKENSEVKLVIVGNKKWWQGEIEDTYKAMKYKDDVIFTGRISRTEIQKISAASLALVFPSFFEGFGMPVLEAFRSETAVITSDVTSLPEIAGDAALMVKPQDTEAIAEAMQSLYKDRELRKKLIEKGKQRAEFFSWDKTSELTWNIIEKYIK
ncbi:MAG: glycosyltransferase family 4 protein [Bacteroidales bacterium]|nr:glycosyltransferase family 4 protein [Bacteroidales bacterium]